MKTIQVFYWHTMRKYDDTPKYDHKAEFEYSKKKRNSITDYFLDKGYSVMFLPNGEHLTLAVTQGKFNQR